MGLRLDETQEEGKRTQRRHDFPASPRIHKEAADFQRLSPRGDLKSRQESVACEANGAWGKSLVDVQHRSSAGMICSLRPETASSEGIVACNRKLVIGNEILDWSHARRVVKVTTHQPAPPGYPGPPVPLAGMASNGHRVHSFGTAAHQYTFAAPATVGYSVRGSGVYNPNAPHVPKPVLTPPVSSKHSL